MKEYLNYKNTNLPWLKKIPSHWTLSKFKFVSELVTGNSLNEDQKIKYESENSEDLPYISSKDIDVDFHKVNYDNGLRIPKKNNIFKTSPIGSFLMVVEGGSSGRKIAFLEQEVCFVNKLCSFYSDQITKFQFYFVQSSNFQDVFKLSMSGLIGGVSIASLKNFALILPSLEEQKKIVCFLDKNIFLINELLLKIEKKIALYEEQKDSIIYEVVTKGLNNNVKFKKSNIDWIGEIPCHWNLNKVGNNTYVKGRIGWKGLKNNDFKDSGPFLITGTDFNNDGSINWDLMYHVDQWRYDEDPYIQVKDKDVLITKDGTIGKVVYVKNLRGPTCLNSGIFLTRPLYKEYLPRYFYWILNSNIFKVFVEYNSGGSTIKHLYQNVFVDFKFPIPPLEEQLKMTNFLDEKINNIDRSISKEKNKIKLLKELKKTLISEVVTGKIKID